MRLEELKQRTVAALRGSGNMPAALVHAPDDQVHETVGRVLRIALPMLGMDADALGFIVPNDPVPHTRGGAMPLRRRRGRR